MVRQYQLRYIHYKHLNNQYHHSLDYSQEYYHYSHNDLLESLVHYKHHIHHIQQYHHSYLDNHIRCPNNHRHLQE